MSSDQVGIEGSQRTSPDNSRDLRLSGMLEALGDATCRGILRVLSEAENPVTVQEIDADCTASLTSIYRKLDQLTAAGLVLEDDGIDADGHRRSRFRPAEGQLEISIGAPTGIELTLYRTATRERLTA